MVGVAEQAYVEIVLRLEFVMFFDSVSRYADNFRISGGKGGLLGGKINGLGRAAGCVIFGVEINDQFFAGKIGQCQILPAIGSA